MLFLEHKHLLRQPYTRDPFPSPDFRIPLGRGSVVQPGSDLTIVTWGATVEKSRQAAALVAAEGGASVEVIDLRSLIPWDHDLVAESVARTGRLPGRARGRAHLRLRRRGGRLGGGALFR